MISALKILLNTSLCNNKLPPLPDNYKNPSTAEEHIIHDVYVWLFHNRYSDLTYHVYLMWNAIRALYATGFQDVQNKDIAKILEDSKASCYFVFDYATEVENIKLLTKKLLMKWKAVLVIPQEREYIPFDLNIHTDIPNMSDLVFCYSDPQESYLKRACKLDRNNSF